MSDHLVLRTARLVLGPVAPGDEDELVRFHAEAVGFRPVERFANRGIELRLYGVTPADALSSACRPSAGGHVAGR